jgi:lysozyme family protein
VEDYVDKLIDAILVQEGGYTNNAADAGGPTNWGITHWDLAQWRGVRDVSAAEVRAMTVEEARAIYRHKYYDAPRMNLLPPSIEGPVMDLGVNAGPTAAVKELQEVLNEAGFGCDVDGYCGPQTARQSWAAWRSMGGFLVNALVERRESFYQSIVAAHPSQRVFLRGWMSRAETFRDAHPTIAEGQADNPPPEVTAEVARTDGAA